MEQRLFIKIFHRDGLRCQQIYLKLLELYGRDALSDSQESYRSREFLMYRENVENARRTGQPVDFGAQLRVQTVFEERPFASARCIAEAKHIPAMTVFYTLAEVLGLKFRHGR
jgi:hypothetical protein